MEGHEGTPTAVARPLTGTIVPAHSVGAPASKPPVSTSDHPESGQDLQRPGRRRPHFPLLAPMFVMGFETFQKQGRILRSDEAEAKGLLEEFDARRHIAIFISHRWWEQSSAGAGEDDGHPDYTTGEKENLKFRTICVGVEELIEECDLDSGKVVLWMDWFCIAQDDAERKLSSIKSLIKYVTLCEFMLIPAETEEAFTTRGYVDPGPDNIPGYGERAWCRLEWFIFMLWSELEGAAEVHLYAVNLEGVLHRYPRLQIYVDSQKPDAGGLSLEKDRPFIRALQEDMRAASVSSAIQRQAGGAEMDLGAKMLSDSEVPELVHVLRQVRNVCM